MSTWATYPEAQARETGSKVSWRYYDKREDADAASEAAKHDAEIQAMRGYDFGYCCPGDIRWVEAGTRLGGANGRWEVCLP
jgi:hypothetical protein